MGGRRTLAAGPWIIGLAAVLLAVWAVVDFARAGAPDVPNAAILAAGTDGGGIELHRDASGDVGRRVRLDGTVVGMPTPGGFWVRDIRDNLVFVGSRAKVGTGAPVRVAGTLARFAPDESERRLRQAGVVATPSEQVIRDVQVVPGDAMGIAIVGGR